MRDDPWDRVSFDFNVKPQIAERDVTRRDLLLSKGPSKLRMLGLTLVGGVAMALLYVWPPLMIAILVANVSSVAWFWPAIGGAALVFWAGLFVLAMRESAADRRYAEQLHLPG